MLQKIPRVMPFNWDLDNILKFVGFMIDEQNAPLKGMRSHETGNKVVIQGDEDEEEDDDDMPPHMPDYSVSSHEHEEADVSEGNLV